MPSQRSRQTAGATGQATSEVEARDPTARSFHAEKTRAQSRHLEQIIQIREASEDGSLGRGRTAKEWLMVAQALVDCPLPFRPTAERQVSRRTRSRGSFITITYTALRPEIALPTASDSRLLHWLLNKVVQGSLQATQDGSMPNRRVEWKSAYEYLTCVGKTLCAENYKDLRSSFARISGLGITIEIEDAFRSSGRIIPFLESWELPKSLDETSRNERSYLKPDYGVALSEPIVAAALDHFVAISYCCLAVAQRSATERGSSSLGLQEGVRGRFLFRGPMGPATCSAWHHGHQSSAIETAHEGDRHTPKDDVAGIANEDRRIRSSVLPLRESFHRKRKTSHEELRLSCG